MPNPGAGEPSQLIIVRAAGPPKPVIGLAAPLLQKPHIVGSAYPERGSETEGRCQTAEDEDREGDLVQDRRLATHDFEAKTTE